MTHPGPVANEFPRRVGPYRIAFVGEAPGADELRLGRPFVGSAGLLLNRELLAVGLLREEVFVGNVSQYKPSPTSNDFWLLDWTGPEVQWSIGQLLRDLAVFQPHLVVALGNVPLHLFKNGNTAPARNKNGTYKWPSKVTMWRGSLFLSSDLLYGSPTAIPGDGSTSIAAGPDLGQGNTGNQDTATPLPTAGCMALQSDVLSNESLCHEPAVGALGCDTPLILPPRTEPPSVPAGQDGVSGTTTPNPTQASLTAPATGECLAEPKGEGVESASGPSPIPLLAASPNVNAGYPSRASQQVSKAEVASLDAGANPTAATLLPAHQWKCLCTLHPAFIQRQQSALFDLRMDLRKARAEGTDSTLDLPVLEVEWGPEQVAIEQPAQEPAPTP